jgi:hypothetical protein
MAKAAHGNAVPIPSSIRFVTRSNITCTPSVFVPVYHKGVYNSTHFYHQTQGKSKGRTRLGSAL